MLIARRTTELTLRPLVALAKRRNFSDDEKEPTKPKPAKEPSATNSAETETAASRLNRLLATMQTDDNLTLTRQAAAAAAAASTTMARPGDAQRQRKEAAKQEANAKDVFAAAKRVAAMLGEGDKKQTESELLSKLLGHSNDAAGDGGGPKAAGGGQPEGELSLSELIVGMKIDRRQQPKEQTRGDFVRRTLSARSSSYQQRSSTGEAGGSSSYGQQRYGGGGGAPRPERKREAESFTGSVNIFGSEPLGIFKQPNALRESPDMLATWSQLRERELRLQVTHPPANYFEKMALWTEQGKVWRFPIDNEQGVPAEEADVDFAEHIFLEQHLEPWCPNRGPIRHFMELVCVGLSKNPYISAREKREHIHWYRDYFEAKRDILRELMSKETATAVGGDGGDKKVAQQLEG